MAAKTEVIRHFVRFTAEEIMELANKAADDFQEMERCRARVPILKKSVEELLETIQTGGQERDVQCRVLMDFPAPGQKTYMHQGEELLVKAMVAGDYQQELFTESATPDQEQVDAQNHRTPEELQQRLEAPLGGMTGTEAEAAATGKKGKKLKKGKKAQAAAAQEEPQPAGNVLPLFQDVPGTTAETPDEIPDSIRRLLQDDAEPAPEVNPLGDTDSLENAVDELTDDDLAQPVEAAPEDAVKTAKPRKVKRGTPLTVKKSRKK